MKFIFDFEGNTLCTDLDMFEKWISLKNSIKGGRTKNSSIHLVFRHNGLFLQNARQISDQ